MAELDKVIKGLERCKLYNKLNCDKCPYDYNGRGNGKSECTAELASDALELLKEQEDLGTELTNAMELIHKKNERIEKLLKEQEAVESKQGEWIYCEDASGQDGYKCSECGFFEPWYYDFENHNFITDYSYCPSCGKPMQEGR